MKRIVTLAALLLLIACTAVQDIADMAGDAPNPLAATQSQSEKLISTGSCPKIEIVEDLAELYEFTNEKDPSPANLISTAEIIDAQSTCAYGLKSVTVDLKLAFQSTIGAHGPLNTSTRPFFSYPFFVAVTSPNGKILAKEVFSASMTYEPGASSHLYHEELRQIVPIKNRYDGSKFKVLIGFQLSDEQLKHNRNLIKQRQAEALAAQQRAREAEAQQRKAMEAAAKANAAAMQNLRAP